MLFCLRIPVAVLAESVYARGSCCYRAWRVKLWVKAPTAPTAPMPGPPGGHEPWAAQWASASRRALRGLPIGPFQEAPCILLVLRRGYRKLRRSLGQLSDARRKPRHLRLASDRRRGRLLPAAANDGLRLDGSRRRLGFRRLSIGASFARAAVGCAHSSIDRDIGPSGGTSRRSLKPPGSRESEVTTQREPAAGGPPEPRADAGRVP